VVEAGEQQLFDLGVAIHVRNGLGRATGQYEADRT
jgi:hypothetical protein